MVRIRSAHFMIASLVVYLFAIVFYVYYQYQQTYQTKLTQIDQQLSQCSKSCALFTWRKLPQ